MPQTIILAVLLGLVLALFSSSLQNRLRVRFGQSPVIVWWLPPAFTAVFAGASLVAGVFSLPLALSIMAYTSAPVLCVFLAGPDFAKKPGPLDFLGVLLLWLPLEFGAGSHLVPRPAQGFFHSVAYGIAILLGLMLFLCFRGFRGMKYNLPRRRSDFWLPLAGFAATAPLLIAVGIPIGFIPLPHLPSAAAGKMAAAVFLVFAGTALPEEILFRSLIQNFIGQRWGDNWRSVAAAAFIFGCAHLDNGPQPLPNWRYMILASIAGVAYGKVFQKSSTVVSSALLHLLVDWTKHFFF